MFQGPCSALRPAAAATETAARAAGYEDEICFYVLDAPSAHQAAPAAQRAGLDPIRVVEAVSSEGMQS